MLEISESEVVSIVPDSNESDSVADGWESELLLHPAIVASDTDPSAERHTRRVGFRLTSNSIATNYIKASEFVQKFRRYHKSINPGDLYDADQIPVSNDNFTRICPAKYAPPLQHPIRHRPGN